MRTEPHWIYSIDKTTGAEYISLSGTTRPRRTGTKVLREGLIIDMDAVGEIVGIEILAPNPPKP